MTTGGSSRWKFSISSGPHVIGLLVARGPFAAKPANDDAFGPQSAGPALIHRVYHTSHSGFHAYCMS